MADKKISALTAASTPLGGTEVVPLVQSSTTKNVTVANLTAGRAVSAASLSTTGNIVSDTLLRVTNAGQIEQNGGNGGLYFLNIPVGGGSSNMRFLTTNASGVAQLQLQLAGGATQINSLYGDTRLETGNLIVATAGKGIDFSATGQATGMTSELLDDYEVGTFTPTMTSASGVTTLNSGAGEYTKIGNIVVAQIQVNIATDASVGTSNFTIGGLPFTSSSSRTARGFTVTSNWTGSDINDGYLQLAVSATSLLWTGRVVNASSRTNNTITFIVTYRT